MDGGLLNEDYIDSEYCLHSYYVKSHSWKSLWTATNKSNWKPPDLTTDQKQIKKPSSKHAGKLPQACRHCQASRQTSNQTGRQAGTQAHKQTDKNVGGKASKQADTHAENNQAGKEANKAGINRAHARFVRAHIIAHQHNKPCTCNGNSEEWWLGV